MKKRYVIGTQMRECIFDLLQTLVVYLLFTITLLGRELLSIFKTYFLPLFCRRGNRHLSAIIIMENNRCHLSSMKQRLIYIYLLGFSVLAACTTKEAQMVDQWLGKKIIISDSLIFTRYGTDTVEFSTQLSDYTILMYVDTFGCTSCKLQLEEWMEWMKYLKRESPYNISFLFDFFPKDEEELSDLLRFYRFDTPVCIDRADLLNRKNKFPKEQKYHTLLLDNKKHVVLIGNPVNNEQIAELYREVLTPSNKEEKTECQTSISISNQEINLGEVPKDSIQAKFKIKNTGPHELIIQHLYTSCDCTSANGPQHPISSGDSTIINVQVRKERDGFFQETITVCGNMKNSPIVLQLTGTAI